MKFPGGNPLLFCEQVGTVTSFFEQWNDCERTVVLYALLKRVPFANLKFLQLSIDYNLAQNYSSQSKLQLLETHANNANFLNKLVQRYQTTCCGAGDAGETGVTTALNNHNNNNNTSIANNNLTISDPGYDSEKKNSTFDLSSTSSSSCSSTSGVSSCASSGSQITTTSSSSSSASSTSSASSASSANNNNNKIDTPSGIAPGGSQLKQQGKGKLTETKKDILNDMLTYLPLLKPGNDDVKSVYMSLIPAAVEDACQQAVPTELVQHILSYLLIHPAVNNDDRRSLSYWLRHLEEHIASSYIPTTLASSAVAVTANNNNNNNVSTSKLANSTSSYFILPPAANAAAIGGSTNPAASKVGSQQSLQFLAVAAGPWQNLQHQQQQQQRHLHHHSHSSNSSSSCNQLPQQQPPSSASSISISNSSLLSKSQQSLNQTSSSSSSSSSCLDSTASQLLKTTNMLVNLDWATEVPGAEEGGGGGEGDGGGGGGDCGSDGSARGVGSMENVTIKEFAPVTFSYAPPPPANKVINNSSSGSNSTSKHHHLIASSSQAQGILGNNVSSTNGSNLNLNGGSSSSNHGHPMVLSDLDSSDDNHLSFSKNGTEIFDYDCDYDNEEEFNYLARAAAAVAAGGPANGSNSTSGGTKTAGSAVTPGPGTGAPSHGGTSAGSSCSKNRVSFDANISDYLRVPPIGVGEFDLDGSSLLKTRRSNSLTTTMSSTCGLSVGELHHQKQNNECLSAENLSNLQLLQNKPRSFSLTMESPRSSLTSSGSETRLDDFKQHQMMKLYGQTNVGMSSIAHWLKSLRLHKYVWLFSNLTYEQMMEMTEEYLASLGVTKGARHKLVICIHKLKERYGVLVRMEKELLATGGSKGQLSVVFEELTNVVLTPMKPAGADLKEDIAGQFIKLLDLIASILLVRAIGGPQDEEYLNIYIWVLERALHNDAFASHAIQIKEYKYKANKIKMQFAPKSHYTKNANLNGSINKPRWTVASKHKPTSVPEGQKTPHRKSSLQYFTPPMQQAQTPQQQQQQSTSSSHSHLQAIPHQYYGHGHNSNAGTGHNNNYNKSSSYPNFASNLSGSGAASGTGTSSIKPHPQHLQQGQGPVQGQQQQQQQPPQAHPPQQAHVPHGNFMKYRHSLNNISHQHQQQFLQQLQSLQQQQQQQLHPSIFLNQMGGSHIPSRGDSNGSVKGKSQPPEAGPPKDPAAQQKTGGPGTTDLLGSKSQNNSIGDINSRLEFLCLQMTEQAIN